MATLNITEYAAMTRDISGTAVSVAQEPAVTTQVVTFTTAAQSNAFSNSTRYVRLVADADCHVLFGADPTATSSHSRIPANVVEWRGIKGNGTEKLSVYDGTSE